MLKEMQNELAKIQTGEIRPYYILYGDDDYSLTDAINRLQTALLPHSDTDFGFASFDCELASERDILEALQNEPLLPVRRVVVLKNFPFFKSKARAGANPQRFLDYLETEPTKAAREFCRLLAAAGYSAEAIKSGSWQELDEHAWEEMGLVPSSGKKDLPIEALKQLAQIIAWDNFVLPSEKNSDGAAISGALPAQPPPLRTVIFAAAAVDKGNKLFKVLGGSGMVLHFEKPKKEAQRKDILIEMARGILAETNKKLSSAAWDTIGKKVGFEAAEAMAAIKKLIAYVGSRENIEAADVENAIGRTKAEAVFELSAALAKKDLQRALLLLGELLERGEHHQVLHALISREVRLLLHAKIIMATAVLGLKKGMGYPDFSQRVFPELKALCQKTGEDLLGAHPYSAYLAFQNSQAFTKEQLVGFLEQLAKMDLIFKSSSRESRSLLERFIVAFCSASNNLRFQDNKPNVNFPSDLRG